MTDLPVRPGYYPFPGEGCKYATIYYKFAT